MTAQWAHSRAAALYEKDGGMPHMSGSARPIGLLWLPRLAAEPGGQGLWNRVGRLAHCAQSSLDPDEWFPFSPDPDTARRQAPQTGTGTRITIMREPTVTLTASCERRYR
jgi:hypothetical protein